MSNKSESLFSMKWHKPRVILDKYGNIRTANCRPRSGPWLDYPLQSDSEPLIHSQRMVLPLRPENFGTRKRECLLGIKRDWIHDYLADADTGGYVVKRPDPGVRYGKGFRKGIARVHPIAGFHRYSGEERN